MSPDPAFCRHICKAKRSELVGDKAVAIMHLDIAAQLTCETDDRLQIEAWRKRLETPQPENKTTKPRKKQTAKGLRT